MSDVYHYISKYKFPNFDRAAFFAIMTELREDFLNDYGNKQFPIPPFQKFQSSVYNLIRKINYLKYNSNPEFYYELLWRTIFNESITTLCFERYFKQYTPEFMDLYNFFDPKRKKKYGKTKTGEKVETNKTINNGVEEAITFMGLPTEFDEKELVHQFRIMSLKMHPDKGGSNEKFIKLKMSRDVLMFYLKTK